MTAARLTLVAVCLATPALPDGDVEYGEYLASECTTCHLVGAQEAEGAVPLITGWDAESFALMMVDYRSGFREHEAMQMIAARLGDEEIAALAAYFATQD